MKAPDPTWALAAEARRREEQERELASLSVPQRTERARAAARSNHVDVRSEIRALERMLGEGRREAAERQLRRLERRANRWPE